MKNVIRSARIESQMTQAELADKLGVSQSTVCSWETGVSLPPTKILHPLAEALSIPVEKLFKGEEEVEEFAVPGKAALERAVAKVDTALEKMDKAGDDIVDASHELGDSNEADRLGAILNDLENLACDLKALRKKFKDEAEVLE